MLGRHNSRRQVSAAATALLQQAFVDGSFHVVLHVDASTYRVLLPLPASLAVINGVHVLMLALLIICRSGGAGAASTCQQTHGAPVSINIRFALAPPLMLLMQCRRGGGSSCGHYCGCGRGRGGSGCGCGAGAAKAAAAAVGVAVCGQHGCRSRALRTVRVRATMLSTLCSCAVDFLIPWPPATCPRDPACDAVFHFLPLHFQRIRYWNGSFLANRAAASVASSSAAPSSTSPAMLRIASNRSLPVVSTRARSACLHIGLPE